MHSLMRRKEGTGGGEGRRENGGRKGGRERGGKGGEGYGGRGRECDGNEKEKTFVLIHEFSSANRAVNAGQDFPVKFHQ